MAGIVTAAVAVVVAVAAALVAVAAAIVTTTVVIAVVVLVVNKIQTFFFSIIELKTRRSAIEFGGKRFIFGGKIQMRGRKADIFVLEKHVNLSKSRTICFLATATLCYQIDQLFRQTWRYLQLHNLKVPIIDD